MSDLPPGFVLDTPKVGALPPGFVLDQPERSTGEKAARLVGQFAQNANDVIASTVGAPVDLLTAGLQKIGLYPDGAPTIKGVLGEQIAGQTPAPPPAPFGGSESIKRGIDYVATLPGRLADFLKEGSFNPLVDNRTSRFDPENRAEKIAAGVGTGTGALATILLPAGAVARAAAPGGLPARIAETLASQPIMQTASAVAGGAATGATDNPYAGLAASLLVPVGASTARGIVSPVTNQLTPQEARIAQFAAQEGVPLTPAQATGSPGLRGLEETMARLPLSSGPMQDAYAAQRTAFNRSILRRAGVVADDASPETLNTAFQRAGQTFDDLAARTVVRPDAQFAQDVAQVEANYGRRLPTDVRPVFQSYMDDLQPLIQAVNGGANPQIAGDVYSTIRSDLARRIRESQSNPPLQRALGGLVNALDDAMERSTSGPLRTEWQQARQEYQALMTIDGAMRKGTQADRSSGNIPFGALKNTTMQGDRAGFARGRGQMNESARLGDFLATRVPNSGTPERMMWANVLTGGSLFGGGLAAGGGPTAAGLASGALAAGAPYAISRLYNTAPVQAYLTNQLAGRTQFAPLLAGEGARQSAEAEDRRMRALAAALMRANEAGAR